MQTAHGHAWECRAPSHDPIVFEEEIHYQKHSVTEHGVPEVHVGTLSRAARRPTLDKVLDCPFGDDFQSPDKVESSVVFSSEALQSHVAGHMKEIALLALQKLPSNDDANTENVDSDQASENDGPSGAVGVARQSMYSVLDDDDLDFEDDDNGNTDDNPERHEEEISARVTEIDLEDKDGLGMTKLHHAVRAGDLELVKSVIQSGVKIDCKDGNDSTPLHYAAEMGLVKCVVLLVEHGADKRVTNDSGFSPFLWAIVAGQEEVTAELLSMGADGDSSSADGRCALAWAVSLGWLSIARQLLDWGADIHDARNTQQTPLLQEAAAFGNLIIVELLVRHGANPNHRDRDGWSAIHWAAEEGHQEIVSFLLDHKANPNVVSSYGTSPLHCAANGGHHLIVSSLLSREEVDPLKSSCHGWTALHHAAFMGHSRVVDLLLQDDRVRSTASLQDNHGWSVLHLAVHSRDLATVRILLDQSIIEDPQTLVDENGLTAEEWLDRGPMSRSQKATNKLAFSKSRCCQAVTELRHAVTIGNGPLIQFLLKSGHFIDGMNSGKRTALYYAVKKRMHSIMDLLLDLGADPNILPTGRKSWEEFISHDDVLQRLKSAGYQRPDTDAEVERQIRLALMRERSQPPEQSIPHSSEADKSPSFEPNHLDIRSPGGPSSPVPLSPTPPSLGHVASIDSSLSPIPTYQRNDNKRKAKSGRTNWLKRLLGPRQ
jgi:ankyrin repeat protein